MTTFTHRNLPVHALLAAIALLGASAAQADRAADLDARAAAEYNRGLDARDAGQNQNACQHFRDAAVLYENSISALMSRYMGSEEARDAIKTAADQQQTRVNGAKARAKELCGLPDGPALTPSGGGSTANDSDWTAEKKLEIQRTVTLAKGQYAESLRLWDAGDKPGACAAIRLSAANFTKVTTAMKANRALEAAFYPVDQLYADAILVQEVRDETICAG